MQTETFDVEVQVVLSKRFKGIELKSGPSEESEVDYDLATNDLKKRILRGTLPLDSFDRVEVGTRFFLPDGKTERFGVLVDDKSKDSTIRDLIRRVYWGLNKTLRRKGL